MTERGEDGKRREKRRAQREGLNKTQNVNMELEMSRGHC